MIYAVTKQLPGKRFLFFTGEYGQNSRPIFVERGRIRVWKQMKEAMPLAKDFGTAREGVIYIKPLDVPWAGERMDYPPTGELARVAMPVSQARLAAARPCDAKARFETPITSSLPYLLKNIGVENTIHVLANEIAILTLDEQDPAKRERLRLQSHILAKIAKV